MMRSVVLSFMLLLPGALRAQSMDDILNSGIGSFTAGRHEEAVADLSYWLAWSHTPGGGTEMPGPTTLAFAYRTLGESLFALGDYSRAVENYTLALSVEGGLNERSRRDTYSLLGNAYGQLEHHARARESYTEALGPNGEGDYRNYLLRGMAYRLEGNTEAYVGDFTEFLDRALENPDRHRETIPLAQFTRGTGYFHLNRLGEAESDLTEAIASGHLLSRRNYALAYSYRGMIRHQTGEIEGAKEDFRVVVGLRAFMDEAVINDVQRILELLESE